MFQEMFTDVLHWFCAQASQIIIILLFLKVLYFILIKRRQLFSKLGRLHGAVVSLGSMTPSCSFGGGRLFAGRGRRKRHEFGPS